jgi:hypothetical protein
MAYIIGGAPPTGGAPPAGGALAMKICWGALPTGAFPGWTYETVGAFAVAKVICGAWLGPTMICGWAGWMTTGCAGVETTTGWGAGAE